MTRRGCWALVVGFAVTATLTQAQEQLGPETNQPLPRWVSMKAEDANARRGPSMNHRVDWIFRHRNMPLLVTAEYGHWRKVEDQDGVGGWVHYVLLSRTRTVVVDAKAAPEGVDFHRQPTLDSDVVAHADPDAIAFLKDECENGWCQVSANRIKGWVEEDKLWGVGRPTTTTAALSSGG